MFIREVIKKNKGYKKEFVYHQLVESYRTEKGPRQRHILDLGKLTISKNKWKTLANRIEEIINGQTSLINVEPEIEALAQHYASLVIQSKQKQVPQSDPKEPDFVEIDINSIKNNKSRTIGTEYVSYEIIKKIGMASILKDLGFKDKEIKIALLLIIGRMVYPASEWATYRWAQNISAIGELLDLKMESLSHTSLYRISDRLLKHKKEIEKHLYKNERTLFSLREKIILYDLTNTYFESSKESDLKHYALSKEKRNDQPLITLGLVLDGEGFPKQSHILSGNISEPATLEKVLEVLGKEKDKTVIMDAGIATDKNLTLLRETGYDYIVVSRRKPSIDESEEGFVEIRHNQQDRVEARLIREGNEVYLFCRSNLKKKKELSMRNLFQERFEADLKYAAESLHKKRGTKKYPKVLERIGRIKQKHRKVSYFYDIHIKEKDGIVTEISWQIKDENKIDDRFSGTYYLRSSRTDLSAQEIWELYISLTDVEDSFRSMKSELGLRPNYHQKDDRISGHLFITVLAHHVVNSLQKYLHKNEIYMRWGTIRQLLSVQVRITTQMKKRDGKHIWLRNTTEPEPFHYLIAGALSIPPKPLRLKKLQI